MKQNLGSKPFIYPLPVLIVGTYGEDGKVSADKLQAISFDPSTMDYRVLGEKAGNAFADGKAIE